MPLADRMIVSGPFMTLALEQLLNGVQFGVMLFLLAAGLTLIFGIMGVINLAHGSLYMIGAYAAALVVERTGSFLLAVPAGLLAAAAAGLLIEYSGHPAALCARPRPAGARDIRPDPVHQRRRRPSSSAVSRCSSAMPPALSGAVEIIPGVPYPTYRIVIIAVGLLVGGRALSPRQQDPRRNAGARRLDPSRDGARARRRHPAALHVVFGLGALLAGLAGLMAGPLLAVQVGMGEQILILTFVVVVIGGVGSVRGAFYRRADRRHDRYAAARLSAGPVAHRHDGVGGRRAWPAGLSSMGIYLVMALVLLIRPQGLFRAQG